MRMRRGWRGIEDLLQTFFSFLEGGSQDRPEAVLVPVAVDESRVRQEGKSR